METTHVTKQTHTNTIDKYCVVTFPYCIAQKSNGENFNELNTIWQNFTIAIKRITSKICSYSVCQNSPCAVVTVYSNVNNYNSHCN